MKYLRRLIRQILNEDTLENEAKDAIKKHYEVYISYDGANTDGNENRGKGKRLIQPVAMGLSKKGNPVIRAFQPNGDTKTHKPAWKLFLLDRIKEWEPRKKQRFNEPPGMYSADGKFNPNGDEAMSRVDFIADFSGTERYKKTGLYPYNQNRKKEADERRPYRGVEANIRKMKPLQGNYRDLVKYNMEKYPNNVDIWGDYDKAQAEIKNNPFIRDTFTKRELEKASASLNNIKGQETVGYQEKNNYEVPQGNTNKQLNYNNVKSGVVPKGNQGKPFGGENDEENEDEII